MQAPNSLLYDSTDIELLCQIDIKGSKWLLSISVLITERQGRKFENQHWFAYHIPSSTILIP